ncbi:MAG TPA: galactokinase [Pyrinomonadaceae bacterium]|nr:galactokinase [Pyrinomonadaceae bacterium]
MIDPEELKSQFIEIFHHEPKIFKAPGRVNLIGEHTDHDEGFVLPIAIDKNIYVAAGINKQSSNSLQIRVKSLNYDQLEEINLDQPFSKKNYWTDYIEGVARILLKKGIKLNSTDLLINSDIPAGAGVSSSAALEVAVCRALTEVNNQPIETKQLALIGQQTEHEFIGVKCGIMDQYVSAIGLENQAILIDCRTLEYQAIPVDFNEVEIVITDSGVKHNLATSAYNDRRQDCKEGLKILRKFYPEIVGLRDLTYSEFKVYENQLPEPVAKRCRHVITENERTKLAAEALRNKDYQSFGNLMWESHKSLKNDYEVTCPELDLLVELARERTDIVYGSRMFGGGFGGSTVTLVKKNYSEDFRNYINSKFEKAE